MKYLLVIFSFAVLLSPWSLAQIGPVKREYIEGGFFCEQMMDDPRQGIRIVASQQGSVFGVSFMHDWSIYPDGGAFFGSSTETLHTVVFQFSDETTLVYIEDEFNVINNNDTQIEASYFTFSDQDHPLWQALINHHDVVVVFMGPNGHIIFTIDPALLAALKRDFSPQCLGNN